MKVKICGITNLEDALLCESLGAYMLGFIFYKKSKRYVEPAMVKSITNKLNKSTLKVGVFVDTPFDQINSISKESGLDFVQLHGSESIEYKKQINIPLIKAIKIKEKYDEQLVNDWEDVTILFDTYNDKLVGGTGISFNHNLIPSVMYKKSIIAGGIGINNIEQILNRNELPFAIDVSSSLEEYEGKKDKNKVNKFFEIINMSKRC